MPKFVTIHRDQPMLLPPDMRDWVPEDDPVHLMVEAVNGLKMEGFRVNERGTGSAQYPPRMMLALLAYCYSHGIFSSRRIEAATHYDVRVRYLTGDTHPDHDTICKFRRDNLEAFEGSFVEVLELALELGVAKYGDVALDGTHVRANASLDRNVTHGRAGEIREQLELEVAELSRQAEELDEEEAREQKLPEKLAGRRRLKAGVEAAQAELLARAEAREEKAHRDYEDKVDRRENREDKRGGKPKPPPPAEQDAASSGEQCNLTDPDSRVMRKNKRSAWEQNYNVQLAVDAGSGLALWTDVVQSASDGGLIPLALKGLAGNLGSLPPGLLADAGYAKEADFELCAELEIDALVATGAEGDRREEQRKVDFRPKDRSKAKKKRSDIVDKPGWKEMGEKMETEENRERYRRRGSSVECAFGIKKEAMGFRRFSMRGLAKVRGEMHLVATAYNLKRIFNALRKAASAPGPGYGSAPEKALTQPPSLTETALKVLRRVRAQLTRPIQCFQAWISGGIPVSTSCPTSS